ncbi:MAG: excinuclease ABC subunit UvrA [Bacteroidales bacterium]|nr:excinuclease ABC subunit UvrA [Bacteroidales bacterium]
MASHKDEIKIRGAKSHNLKNISLDIPRGKFVVVTGLSGSGKSTLAFDTLYAEGQRRYMDTLSTYAKHFMGIMEKPQVESITGLSPIIAIEQKTTGNNPRSTVGTITEVYDFLRLLYARASTAYSPATGKAMVRYTDEQIISLLLENYAGKRCYLLAPLVSGRKGNYKDLFDNMRRRGFNEVRINGEIKDLAAVGPLDRYKTHFIELVVDKLKPSDSDMKRLRDSVATALNYGKGSIAILESGAQGAEGQLKHYSKHLVCADTGFSIAEPAPHSFSFNSPQGYCPHCKGLGSVVNVDMDAIIPDRERSIADGAIVPLGAVRGNKKFEIIHAIARKYDFSIYDPVSTLPDEVISLLVYGSDELFRIGGDGFASQLVCWDGVVDDIEEKIVCPVCKGTRLRPEAEYFRIDGKTISEVAAMEISDLHSWICSLPEKLDERAGNIARDIIKELRDRSGFLLDVGLDYLTLDRPTATLSGGESQRIRLATQIGSRLVNVLYILDEPSIGLHPRDNVKLINSLLELRDQGNSVMVVEHDAQTMLAADWLIDIGPGAGINGGEICYSGPVTTSDRHVSTTLDYLTGRKKIEIPKERRKGNGLTLGLRGCCGNNLKNVDIDFPLGCLIGIAGVSGSGKSSLIDDTLMPILKNHYFRAKLHPLPYAEVTGLENIDKVIEVDQSPIGRTPRSNPATFTDVFGDIRELFAATPDAKIRGFKAGRFSFNVSGGRCEECKGAGIQVIQMNFLPSVNVVCPECRGRRYKEDTLAVRYKGRNIGEVLDMTIEQAYEFFQAVPSIAGKLKALLDVGLGYVQLGQSSVTLSGGESQRMKLAAELGKKGTGKTLYILDEPTTGLHFEDIKVLLDALQSLVDAGNTVIIIEHNLDILKSVDYIFDMGPEGGKGGGLIVAKGTPEQLAEDPASVTGKYLKEELS